MSNSVVTDWPSGSANTGWPQEPTGMLMPGRVEGWPAGTQRAANAAERLLSQAVAWWDVGQYRDGDRFLRNRGTGGELLDLRLGSSIVANSNDPKWLGPEDSGYVYCTSSTDNRFQIPDEAALDVTDLDVRVRISFDDADAANGIIARTGSDPNRAWFLRGVTGTAGAGARLQLDWYPTGSAAGLIAAGGTAGYATGFRSGDIRWVRVTLDVDNGAGGYEVKFFTAPDSVEQPSSWTQLGATITGGSTTSLPNVTQSLLVGQGAQLNGKVFRAVMLDGINGNVIVDIDCDAITSGSATSFTALTGQTVTINRSTSGRKSVAMPSRHKGGRPVMLLGTDDYLEVQGNWQHQLLNFGQGDSFTVVAAVRDWHWSSSPYIVKSASFTTATDPGYTLYSISVGNSVFVVKDGTTSTSDQTAGGSLGSFTTFTGVRNVAADTIGVYTNGTIAAAVTDATASSLANTQPLRIGRVGSSYGDTELFAAAVFRRALSPAEITLLTNYFTGRIA